MLLDKKAARIAAGRTVVYVGEILPEDSLLMKQPLPKNIIQTVIIARDMLFRRAARTVKTMSRFT